MDSSTKIPASNPSFSAAIGVHYTTASRYRNGGRLPSPAVALKMAEVYGLDVREMMAAMAAGTEAFGHYIRMNVFGPEPAVDLNEDGSEKEFVA